VRRTKLVVFIVAAGLLAPACTVLASAVPVAGSTMANTSTSTVTTVAPTTTVAPSADDVAASITATGLEVVDTLDAPTSGISVTRDQLEVMAAEVVGGSGILGGELDTVTPMPQGAPPLSYLLAAWLHDAPTPRAQLARSWYPGETDWTQAPTVLFPRAVLLLFIVDVAEQANTELPPLPADQTFVVPSSAPTPEGTVAGLRAGPVGAACDLISGFFTNQIAALFDMLRLRTDFLGGGALGFIGGIIATVWNTAVDLASAAVQRLVRNLGEPVLQAIGQAIAIAGIVSHVSTYVTGWHISVQANPQVITFPVAPAPPLTGQFVVTDASSRPWQPELQQCAQAFGVAIPRVLEPDAPIRWDIVNNAGVPDGRAPLISPTSPLTGVVPSQGSPLLEYTTGQDPSADGDLGLGNVTVTVGMSRSELTKLLQLVQRLVDNLVASIVNFALPVPALAEPVSAELQKLLRPLLDDLARAIGGGPAGVFELTGRDQLFVRYLRPRDPATTPSPAPPPAAAPADPRAAFCTKLDELYPLAADVMDWAGTGAAGIDAVNQLIPLAPAELQDEMATMMAMYQASSTVSGPLPNEAVLAVAEPFAYAAITVFEYCGFTYTG
jgi:hypothetical protein